MVIIKSVKIIGSTEKTTFDGEIQFSSGLQVVNAKNGYGKSTISSSIIWALGLEPLYVGKPNDPSMLQEALRTSINLQGSDENRVTDCKITLVLENSAGETMTVTRGTSVEEAPLPQVVIQKANQEPISRKLKMRYGTRESENSGFQFVFEKFASIHTHDLMTYQGTSSPIYLENIAPLFFIDQLEGWANIQAQQITKYGLLQIYEAAVELLLSLDTQLDARLLRQQFEYNKSSLRSELKNILEKINLIVIGTGSKESLSIGTLSLEKLHEVYKNYSVAGYLSNVINWNYESEKEQSLREIAGYEEKLATPDTNLESRSHATELASRISNLRRKINAENEEIGNHISQLESQERTLELLKHRERTSNDLLRLKRDGIGFPDSLSCPTCHNDIDPLSFDISSQDVSTIENYVISIKKEQDLLRKNIKELNSEVFRLQQWEKDATQKLKVDEQNLEMLFMASSSKKQDIADLVFKLTRSKSKLELVNTLNDEIIKIQETLKAWVKKVESSGVGAEPSNSSRPAKITEFESLFREFLFQLGHSSLSKTGPDVRITLDEHYTPMFSNRRLRSLGAASDQARMVLAYSSALYVVATNSDTCNHPGFAIYDEPFQQKPDELHVDLLLKFFSTIKDKIRGQVIVFTSLTGNEKEALNNYKINVRHLDGEHFLEESKKP